MQDLHEWCTGISRHHLHMRRHLPLPRPRVKMFRHDISCAKAHRRKLGHDHWMATQHQRRRRPRVLNRREQEQETARDTCRRHRFLWHPAPGSKGRGKALEDPILVAMARLTLQLAQ